VEPYFIFFFLFFSFGGFESVVAPSYPIHHPLLPRGWQKPWQASGAQGLRVRRKRYFFSLHANSSQYPLMPSNQILSPTHLLPCLLCPFIFKGFFL
jgi:hypothetical protein